MLLYDNGKIGNKMLMLRKRLGLTQAEVAEKAGLSDRTYADIERGNVNMRTDTLLHICEALCVTPDAILTESNDSFRATQEEIGKKYADCSEKEKQVVLALVDAYLKTLLS